MDGEGMPELWPAFKTPVFSGLAFISPVLGNRDRRNERQGLP